MKLRSRPLFVLVSVLGSVQFVSGVSTAATVKSGSSCKKADLGKTVTVAGKKLTCLAKGASFAYGVATDKGKAAASPSPASTAAPAATPTTASASSPAPSGGKSGGTLTVLVGGETRGLDPTVGAGSAIAFEIPKLMAIYDTLFYVDNKSGSLKMGTAESFRSTDGIVWTLKIKPNIKFSDGTSYDANAVKFNWDRHADPANSSTYLAIIRQMKSYEVVDPATVRIVLNAENGQFFRTMSASSLMYIASPKGVQEKGKDFNNNPVGGGPYVIKDWVRDSQMTLVKSPSYWNASEVGPDTVIIKVVVDEQQRLNAVLNGEADVTNLGQLPLQKIAKDRGFPLQLVGGINTNIFIVNQTRPPFNNPNVRRAVQLAIDQDAVNQIVNGGLGEVSDSWFPDDNPFYDRTIPVPRFNLTVAQQLMSAAVTANGGRDIDIEFNMTVGPQFELLGQYLQAAVGRLPGVNVKVNYFPVSQHVANIVSRNFQAAYTIYAGLDPEPNFAETFRTGGQRNQHGYTNRDVDAALLKARAADDAATRKAAYQEVQRLIAQDQAAIVLPRGRSAYMRRASVSELPLFEDGGLLYWAVQRK